ncbi:hypothetical protein [Acidovorax sp.]|uniref:hypothetical protein n=1 Tax=Acidovorax sp. TaxID=1872122 RepID=UPI0025C5CB1F|nr:hypothetical protein [Acidovorax sp.]
MHPSFYLARCATLTRCARPVLAALGLTVAAVTAHAAAPQDLRAGADAEVVERLPERVGAAPATPQAAATAARRWITLSRDMADPRYLGRAQAALAPWWGQPGAPAELLVLQATVEQARHEFTAARATLERALQANPAQVQGWLTLATLERVAARYPAAENACRNVARHGATMYAAACTLETRSLQGQHDAARSGLTALAQQLGAAPAQRAWVLSLLAESEERAGRDDAAEAAYRRSLADVADGYTALAYADHLLRRGRASAVLDVLRGQPASDAVLLRRAYALRLLGDDAWRPVAAEVQERFAAIAQRGEGLDAHARERALMALWLDARPDVAWQAARTNLTLQKEPLDWWLALQASEQSRDTAAHRAVVQALAQTGLQDARLARWQPQAATKTSAQEGQ